MQKEAIDENELKLNGYYYLESEGGYCSFFLYENGVFLSNGCSNNIESLEKLDVILSGLEYQQRKNKNQYVWGVYEVRNNKVIIERWEPWNGWPYKVKRSEGNLISNTELSTSIMKNLEALEIYKFREFMPKPDSKNSFIKF